MTKIAQKCQTWAERLADPDKLQLDGAFVESLALTAVQNERAIEDLWVMWRTYVETCEGYDQSPTFREFCAWSKLAGAGPLS